MSLEKFSQLQENKSEEKIEKEKDLEADTFQEQIEGENIEERKPDSEAAGESREKTLEKKIPEKLSNMTGTDANRLATQIFLRLTSDINYYIRKISEANDENARIGNGLEKERSALRRKIGYYFNEKKPVIPNEGFVSVEMKNDLESLHVEAQDLYARTRAHFSDLPEDKKVAQGGNFGRESSRATETGVEKEKELEMKIAEATNFEELIEVVRTSGGIQGSKQFFSAEYLIEAINNVRKGVWDIDYITEGCGLRKKVEELLKKKEGGEAEVDADKKQEAKENRETGLELKSEAMMFGSPQHEKESQDSIINNKEFGIFGALDGMGGEKGGKMAAEEAKDVIYDFLKKGLPKINSIEEARELMGQAFQEGNKKILQMRASDPELSKMATTATIPFVFQGHLVTGHVGDSRAYLFKKGSFLKKGKLEQLTKDDSTIPEEYVKKHNFNNITNPKKELKGDDFALDSWKKWQSEITNYLGKASMKPSISVQKIEKGDKFLFCTDGMVNLKDKEILEYLNKGDFATMMEEARKRSNEDYVFSQKYNKAWDLSKRYKYDDISAVLVEVGK